MDQLLLDTHVIIQLLSDLSKIPTDLQGKLYAAELYISAASLWEIAIKARTGKLTIKEGFFAEIDQLQCEELPITHEHARQIVELEVIHSDPFDRMLLAQAQVEGLVLVTDDKIIRQYGGLRTMWAL